MDATKAVELIREYSKCPKCGNDKVGNEEGSVEIHGDTYTRKCKCGWSIVVKED